MEAPRLAAEPAPAAPRLRLLEGRDAAPDVRFASLRAWILLFGSLAACGGHGVFLFAALTRMEKVPGRAELGHGLELVVLGWFLAAAPLALLGAALRRRFLALSAVTAWSLASGVALASLAAFAYYVCAIALA
jgi:hypothetical protein